MTSVPRLCSIDGCAGHHKAKGYCAPHYNRLAKPAPIPSTDKCTVAECEGTVKYTGLCSLHYYRKWRESEDRGVCSASGCQVYVHIAGLCSAHYHEGWRREDPERASKPKRKYYENNKEHIYALNKAWAINNPERYAENSRNITNRRRARIRSTATEAYSEKDILDMYGTACYLCEGEIDLTAPRRAGVPGWEASFWRDHYIPISQGGSDTLDNLRPSHALCNIKKGNKMPDEEGSLARLYTLLPRQIQTSTHQLPKNSP